MTSSYQIICNISNLCTRMSFAQFCLQERYSNPNFATKDKLAGWVNHTFTTYNNLHSFSIGSEYVNDEIRFRFVCIIFYCC